jgi:hypothetical protein
MRKAAFALTWVLTIVAVPADSDAQAAAAASAIRPWPCRLVVEEPLLSVIEDAWRRSPTLQQQCRALADAGSVVRLEWGNRIPIRGL